MNSFEPGEYVRLRSGGRKMQVINAGAADSLPASSLVACEYRAKSRRVLGFYAAHSLIRTSHSSSDIIQQ
ncbi:MULTISPECIES: hypothetical protein [Pseudomonas]|nr:MULTISPECIES: hypothetical protein [Pseudomonas]AHF67682.1 hypothetical protein PCH70_25290 [Pseudomonas cichorii JBC1]QVE19515.1 hypothetical protein KGD89_12615 [Pseudomonas cichorii]SDO84748.1 hypothetical protein SAMN05216599_1142 [Pseudomonas cichorii]GFM77926.1 hypothetical protein PSCICM_37450 [Pseudomonas cichorii]GFM90029.1 hypothetical protein PSCICP_00010 [Pseudomonas cichorii]